MLIQWMAYATIVAALVACGALAVEQIVAIWGGARRAVWIVALAIAAITPLALAMRRAPAPAPVPATGDSRTQIVTTRLTDGALDLTARPSVVARAMTAVRSIHISDEETIGAWCIASLVLLALLMRAAVALRGMRARWREGMLDGERVLVAEDVGPAVVGTVRPRIVVPAWALALNATERQLMLRHELEHIRRGDPQLYLVASLAVIAFPWNPALWLIVQRLRMAVEMDCDKRVLRAANHPREYGLLLIAVGARQRASFQLAASLAERRPLLERRIKAMTMDRPLYPRIATLSLVLLAAGATTAATRTPHPRSLRATATVGHTTVGQTTVAAPVQSRIDKPAAQPSSAPVEQTRMPAAPHAEASAPATSPAPHGLVARRQGEVLTLDEIRALVRQYYPSVLTGDTTIAMITFIVDANHRYLMSQTSPNAPDRDVMVSGFAGGRGGRGAIVGDAVMVTDDSASVARMSQLLAAMKEKLETLRQRRDAMDTADIVVRGRGSALADATSDSAQVLLKLAMEKVQGERGAQGVQANVKDMLKMLHEQSGISWSGITMLQSHYAAGLIGPRAITIVGVALQQ